MAEEHNFSKVIPMPKSLLSSMQRMMRPAKLSKKSRSILIASAFAPYRAGPAKTAATASQNAVGLMVSAAQSMMPGAAGGSNAQTKAPPVPKGAQFSWHPFRCAQGSRHYKIYLPACAAHRQPNGLIVMLHGCGQNPDDFATGTHMNSLAEKHGLVVVYPAQTRRHNPRGCWNWFAPGHQARGAGEPAILAALTRKVMRDYSIPRDHVYVAGLSAGGAMAAILVDTYPDVFAAAGIHSGLARGAARDMRTAMAAMRSGAAGGAGKARRTAKTSPVRRIIFQGDQDSTVHQSNAQHLVTAALGDDPAAPRIIQRAVRKMGYTRSDFATAGDTGALELWLLQGGGHAWSGGRVAGSYTDAKGPDASTQMVRFFLAASR